MIPWTRPRRRSSQEEPLSSSCPSGVPVAAARLRVRPNDHEIGGAVRAGRFKRHTGRSTSTGNCIRRSCMRSAEQPHLQRNISLGRIVAACQASGCPPTILQGPTEWPARHRVLRVTGEPHTASEDFSDTLRRPTGFEGIDPTATARPPMASARTSPPTTRQRSHPCRTSVFRRSSSAPGMARRPLTGPAANPTRENRDHGPFAVASVH